MCHEGVSPSTDKLNISYYNILFCVSISPSIHPSVYLYIYHLYAYCMDTWPAINGDEQKGKTQVVSKKGILLSLTRINVHTYLLQHPSQCRNKYYIQIYPLLFLHSFPPQVSWPFLFTDTLFNNLLIIVIIIIIIIIIVH